MGWYIDLIAGYTVFQKFLPLADDIHVKVLHSHREVQASAEVTLRIWTSDKLGRT